MTASHDLRRVIAAEGVSNFGSMLSRLAIPWVATLMLGATPAAMAWLLVADVAAAAIGSLLLGGVIDRAPKRLAMRCCDGLRALVLAAVAVGAWQGWVSMPLLVAAAAAGGMLTAAFELARSAWIAQRVDAGGLPTINARLSMVSSVAETVAFALGGWLYQLVGAALALGLDGLSYLGSALLLRGVREAPRVLSPDAGRGPSRSWWHSWWGDLCEGWRVLLQHPRLRALAAVETLRQLGLGLAGTSYMIYVARDLALPTGVQGMVFALGSVGAFAGAAMAPLLGRAIGSGGAMACGLALLCIGALCIPAAQGAGLAAVALLVAHQLIGDGGETLHDVHDRTLRQTAVAAAWLARVDAALRGIGQAATLAGAALGGAIGSALSARSVLVLSAGAFGAAALWAWLALTRRDAAGANG
jgi:Na+/melibiose symporter-like transporter